MDLKCGQMHGIWLEKQGEKRRLGGENSGSTTQKWGGVWTALGMTASETVEAPCRGLVGKKAKQLRQEQIVIWSLGARPCSQHQVNSNGQNKAPARRDLSGATQIPFSRSRDLIEKLVMRWQAHIIKKKKKVQINHPPPKKKNMQFCPTDTGQRKRGGYKNW